MQQRKVAVSAERNGDVVQFLVVTELLPGGRYGGLAVIGVAELQRVVGALIDAAQEVHRGDAVEAVSHVRGDALRHDDGHDLADGAAGQGLLAVDPVGGFGDDHQLNVQLILFDESSEDLGAFSHAHGIGFFVGYGQVDVAAGQFALVSQLRVFFEQSQMHAVTALHVAHAAAPDPFAAVHVETGFRIQISLGQFRFQFGTDLEGHVF